MSIPFVGANLVSATLLLALARWQQRRRRFLTDGHLARRHTGSRLVRKNLQAASVAASSGQADAFFKSARFCISECVSHLSPGTPDAQTLVSSDCVEILRDSEAPQELQDGTAEILNAADSFQFAGLVPDSGELKALQQKLTKVISDLNRLSK